MALFHSITSVGRAGPTGCCAHARDFEARTKAARHSGPWFFRSAASQTLFFPPPPPKRTMLSTTSSISSIAFHGATICIAKSATNASSKCDCHRACCVRNATVRHRPCKHKSLCVVCYVAAIKSNKTCPECGVRGSRCAPHRAPRLRTFHRWWC